MKIPDGPRGVPTVSVSMLRSYGVAGFDVGLHEESKGCPRQFYHRYVARDAPKTKAEVLVYGSVIHAAFEHMEVNTVGPEDALAACWDPTLGPDRYAEALADLRDYLDRPAESAAGAVLASEVGLDALLCETDQGPVWLRGFVDRVEVDYTDEKLLRVRDFKTNRTPPSLEDVRGDAQGKAYSWLVLQNLDKFGYEAGDPDVHTIFHLDAIKWRELPPVYFSPADLEAWHAWMVAVVRHIQADDTHEPVLNPGCATCPVRDSCPAFQGLADTGTELRDALADVKPDDREALTVWRERANATRLLLEKAVKEVDGRFKADAEREHGLAVAGFVWTIEEAWRNTTDAVRLHQEIGSERFYRLVSDEISVAGLEREVAGDDPAVRARALDTVRRVLVGTKVTRKKGKTT